MQTNKIAPLPFYLALYLSAAAESMSCPTCRHCYNLPASHCECCSSDCKVHGCANQICRASFQQHRATPCHTSLTHSVQAEQFQIWPWWSQLETPTPRTLRGITTSHHLHGSHRVPHWNWLAKAKLRTSENHSLSPCLTRKCRTRAIKFQAMKNGCGWPAGVIQRGETRKDPNSI